VECAKKAVEIAPDVKYAWNTLGAAYYRADEWVKSVTALEKSMEIRDGGDSFDWFFLAMAHQKLGHEKEARQWYDRSVRWMEQNAPQHDELLRLRAEARALLQIQETKPCCKDPKDGKKPQYGALFSWRHWCHCGE
jgi:tetratricopeptide (TPR) repeat protein